MPDIDEPDNPLHVVLRKGRQAFYQIIPHYIGSTCRKIRSQSRQNLLSLIVYSILLKSIQYNIFPCNAIMLDRIMYTH